MFQFTLPRGERLTLSFSSEVLGRFQFTLPRGERQVRDLAYTQLQQVSIHAPARGATEVLT